MAADSNTQDTPAMQHDDDNNNQMEECNRNDPGAVFTQMMERIICGEVETTTLNTNCEDINQIWSHVNLLSENIQA